MGYCKIRKQYNGCDGVGNGKNAGSIIIIVEVFFIKMLKRIKKSTVGAC